MWETWVQSLGWEDTLEKGKTTIPVFWPGEFHECIVLGVEKSQTQLKDLLCLSLILYFCAAQLFLCTKKQIIMQSL